MKARTRRRVSISSSRLKGLLLFVNNFSIGFASKWKTIRPGFVSSNGKATAVVTTNPIQAVTMSSANVTSKIVNNTGNSGSGIALWVKDALNWWGIGSKQVDSYYGFTYSCGCGVSHYPCNCVDTFYPCNCVPTFYSCNCIDTYYPCNCSTNGPYGVQCQTNGPYSAYLFDFIGLYFYYTYSCNFYYYTYTCGDCIGTPLCQTCQGADSCQNCVSGQSCQTCSFYSCGTCSGTGTTNNYYLKLYNSVSGTVSEIASVTLSAVAKSIQVVTNGLGITGKAYSDTGFATQTGGDLTYTASSATPTKLHGILLVESTQNQSYTIDSFESTKN